MKPDPTRIRELFVEVLAKVDPQRWDAFLESECGGDQELLDQVGLLLEAHREAGTFLERPATGSALAGDSGSSPLGKTGSSGTKTIEGLGTVIGPYKLLQIIGEGGMGTVYMAEQT